MTTTIDTAAVESLRTFALANGEPLFAHLCTAALNREGWAVERIESVLRLIALANAAERWREGADRSLDVILSTDTSRPDGAIARRIEI